YTCLPSIRNHPSSTSYYFSFNNPHTTAIYTLSLHDALPICFRVIAQQGHRSVAIGEEKHAIANPHGIEVVRIVARNGGHAGIGKLGYPNRRSPPAAVALPNLEGMIQRNVG